ncbi:hypothetical protein PSA7680_00250 [Pseudoruegeria aquimaris]|uniref:Uncharacterized protein n=1 Tax=Pseudoruegeria aquimaris TaxID=393663 RepID=A0A1Y5REU8_9RHOB|nr:hypothetical protein PSA7680_00250 [Pseudoruegeria aquimaris]
MKLLPMSSHSERVKGDTGCTPVRSTDRRNRLTQVPGSEIERIFQYSVRLHAYINFSG